MHHRRTGWHRATDKSGRRLVWAPERGCPSGVTEYIQSQYLSAEQDTGCQLQNIARLQSAVTNQSFTERVGGVLAVSACRVRVYIV